ncbi:unnamed protein product [Triticum turgidum subsp. durum]|uniref:beta-N-acetylhexosaminidase n=1 Tax=Triticum turgidum subsp. durum TaxID=4567 RepID=A0A9R0PZQ0_TRITD|nr:unnamed protein product [Triticum turgidum subsp. durum]
MPPKLLTHLLLALVAVSGAAAARRHPAPANFTASGNPVYIWPLPKNFTSGTQTLAVDPDLALDPQGAGAGAAAVAEAFERYRHLIFSPWAHAARPASAGYDVARLTVVVASADETLELGVDESYTIYIAAAGGANSIVGGATIEANTIYGAIRGLETFSQLCVFNYDTKNVEVRYAPWYIQDEPRFAFRGLMLDTSRHYLPVDVIKQVIDSMSFSKLNVLHWHIIDEQSFPLEIPSYPNLWKGSYSKSERYTVEDARYIVSYAKKRGIHVMAEIDVPGHVKQWLDERNMTTKDAYKYFVLKAQEIAIDLNWIPVNWEETFNSFGGSLNPRTVVHNWLGPGVCPKVVAKGLRCIMSNQGVWYLDHLDVPWEEVYTAEPLAGINDSAQQKLVLGGEVCMWGETADTSDVQQTIWPRAAAAAERMWSQLEAISAQDLETTVLARLHYFRCLLNHRGIAAAPVTNFYARRPPIGPGSCFVQ